MGDINPIYYRNLPRKHMAAASLLMNKDKEVLLVQPLYKDTWDLPSGVVHENESPQAACERAVKEAFGLTVKTDRLLIMDFLSKDDQAGDTLRFIFLGGLMSENMIKDIRLNKEKYSEFAFAPLDTAVKMVNSKIAKRLLKAFDALENYATLVLQDGEYT